MCHNVEKERSLLPSCGKQREYKYRRKIKKKNVVRAVLSVHVCYHPHLLIVALNIYSYILKATTMHSASDCYCNIFFGIPWNSKVLFSLMINYPLVFIYSIDCSVCSFSLLPVLKLSLLFAVRYLNMCS